MAGGWNPWRALRAREHVHLEWRDLPDGIDGFWAPLPGGRAVIALAARLRRTERRCVLAHELVHDERGFVTSLMPRALAEKEERAVEVEVARRLVPLDDLRSWITVRVDVGDLVTVASVAEEWDVADDVARRALSLLPDLDRC